MQRRGSCIKIKSRQLKLLPEKYVFQAECMCICLSIGPERVNVVRQCDQSRIAESYPFGCACEWRVFYQRYSRLNYL